MNKTQASAILAFLMVSSSLAFVIAFLPQQGGQREKVEIKPFYEKLSADERDALLYNYGITIVTYPSRDEFFNETLSRLPSLTGKFVVVALGNEFSIESANGYKRTTNETWLKDLCGLMVRGSLPDCVKFENGNSSAI